jgi:hypothetical protein
MGGNNTQQKLNFRKEINSTVLQNGINHMMVHTIDHVVGKMLLVLRSHITAVPEPGPNPAMAVLPAGILPRTRESCWSFPVCSIYGIQGN